MIFVSNKKILCLLAILFLAACDAYKARRELNCLNPKSTCFARDNEAPNIVSTVPASQPSQASPLAVATLNTIILNFSEPMKNADALEGYSNPTGGGNSLQIISVSNINAQTYQLNLTGAVGSGSVAFDLQHLTDLAGNRLAPATITLLTSSIAAVPDFVSGNGGYAETNITWTNTTPDAMNYLVKKNGSNCATASAVTGANVSGTVLSNGQVTTNLAFTQITTGATDTVRVCLTPVATGSATEFTVSVTRDDSIPTLNTLALTRCQLPYLITLTCSDNADRIIYTIDGSVPSFTIVTSGASIGASASANAFEYPVGGYSLTTRGLVTFRYLCIDKSGHLNAGGVQSATCQSKGVWGSHSNGTSWFGDSPAQPYDVWD